MSTVSDVITGALVGRRLLDHPFYERWQAGELSRDELRSYASQYRHFEAMLPTFLQELVQITSDDAARDAARANLRDELGPPSHLELFDLFVDAVGAEGAAPTIATTELVGAYAAALRDGPATGFAGLAAYEVQAADIATTKAAGLKTHYGVSGDGLRFWEAHGEIEAEHAAWTLDALGSVTTTVAEISTAAEAVAAAWWRFLDEREELAGSVA